MKKLVIMLFTLAASFPLRAGEDMGGVRNYAYEHGESISNTIFYSVIGIYVNAGTANFTTYLEKLNNKDVYHVVGIGSSNPSYDWIFKVRDRYESYIDTATLQPYKFIRNVDENGYKTYENVTFNHQTNTAITAKGVYKVPSCIQEVLSSIYYARNLDFNNYKVDDKIPFDMFLDNQVYPLYIRYLGKVVIKTKYGKIRAIKFRPLLINTIFTGGEKMSVWVSGDANHIPLRTESQIVVGSVKVDMM
jgi:hypothetical protein